MFVFMPMRTIILHNAPVFSATAIFARHLTIKLDSCIVIVYNIPTRRARVRVGVRAAL